MDNYEQIPQLSCGGRYDLDEPLRVSSLIPSLVLVNLSRALTVSSYDSDGQRSGKRRRT